MKKIEIKEGSRFNKLTVVCEVEKISLPSGQTNRAFKCICDCGNQTVVRLVHLKRGRISSCGCNIKTRNGMSKNPLLKIWRAIKYRTSENYFERHLYFDKGIKVCEEWENNHMSFINWSEKNGYKKGLQIDRIDNSKGYSPENCRWVEPYINVNNRDSTLFVNYNGETQALSIILRNLNITDRYHLVRNRISRGWDAYKAIHTPARNGNYKRKTKQL